MRKQQTTNRTENLPMIRLTPMEKNQVLEEYEETFHQTLADFVREKLFSKEITVYNKRKVDALLKLGDFRGRLIELEEGIIEIAKAVIGKNDKQLQSDDTQLLEELLRELVTINESLDKIVLTQ